jgi:acyl carrier protein
MSERAGARTGEIGTWLVGVCRDLGLPVDGTGDDFFEAGGNSLHAVRLIAKVEERFGEDALLPDDLFASESIGDMASAIARQQRIARENA